MKLMLYGHEEGQVVSVFPHTDTAYAARAHSLLVKWCNSSRKAQLKHTGITNTYYIKEMLPSLIFSNSPLKQYEDIGRHVDLWCNSGETL